MIILTRKYNKVRKPGRLSAYRAKYPEKKIFVTKDGEYFAHENGAKKHSKRIGQEGKYTDLSPNQ